MYWRTVNMKLLLIIITFTIISIIIVSSLLSFMFSNFYYQQKLKPYNDEKITNIALEVSRFIENEENINLDNYLTNTANIGYQIYLTDSEGNDTFYGDEFRDTTLTQKTKNDVLNGEIFHGILNFPQETFVTGFFANELTNTIGVPLEHDGKQYAIFLRPNIKMLFNEMHILFAWLLGLMIVLSIILVLMTTKYLIHPITKLTTATEKLSEGDFSLQLDIDRDDEIGKLAKSFTHMMKQLEKLDDMKTEFIENISHDFQTPLANIKGYVNLINDKSLNEETKSQYIVIIQNEINRLSNLAKQLLLLASLDRYEGTVNKEVYSLSEQLKKIIHHHEWLIQEKAIMISYDLPEINIKGDPSLLANVWDNLLSNAIKYNKEGGNIEIAIFEETDDIKVMFKDSGIGIKKEIKKQVFDRFYRAEEVREKEIEGTGLGLSIVLSIIKMHDGKIEINSIENEGTTFVVSLPQL